MSHLSFETIARLVDERPSADETAHLDACAVCRTELEDMRADAAALAALPPIDPPDAAWHAIESRLGREGLIRRRLLPAHRGAILLRIAAALVLFALGTATGVAFVSGRGPTAVSRQDAAATAPQPVAQPQDARSIREPSPSQLAAAESAVDSPEPRVRRVPVVPAALQAAPQLAAFFDGEEPESYEDAVQLYRETEMLYLDALTRMAEMSGTGEVGDPMARLAALEAITSITRTALGQAPADPVLNGYHVTALAQRDATLRQIAARASDSWF